MKITKEYQSQTEKEAFEKMLDINSNQNSNEITNNPSTSEVINPDEGDDVLQPGDN